MSSQSFWGSCVLSYVLNCFNLSSIFSLTSSGVSFGVVIASFSRHYCCAWSDFDLEEDPDEIWLDSEVSTVEWLMLAEATPILVFDFFNGTIVCEVAAYFCWRLLWLLTFLWELNLELGPYYNLTLKKFRAIKFYHFSGVRRNISNLLRLDPLSNKTMWSICDIIDWLRGMWVLLMFNNYRVILLS